MRENHLKYFTVKNYILDFLRIVPQLFSKQNSLLLKILFLSLILQNSVAGFSQSNKSFNRIGVDQGLSQSTIFAIMQDHNGFMWFGTHDGLNKYDNYNFTVYKHLKGDTNSLADNIVYAICQSKLTNDIWIGTNDGGLCCFDYETENFTSYKSNSYSGSSFIQNAIKNIVEDEDGLIWFNYDSWGGVSSFNPNSLEVKNYPFNPEYPDEPNYGEISICLDSKGYLWASSDKGLYQLDRSSGIFKSYQHDINNPNSIPSNLLSSIYEDENYIFWIGSDDGLIRFDALKNQFKLYQYQENDAFSISSNKAFMSLRDENGKLWISTRNGLNQFNDSTQKFWAQQHNPIDKNSLSSNNLSVLYLDKGGVLWIGTYEDGLNKFDTHAKKFVPYTYNPKNPKGIPNKTVRSIYEDKYGILWVGFINGGLVRIDRKLNTVKSYDLKPPQKSASDPTTVSAIWEDYTGSLWIGSWEYGLAKAKLKGKGRNREIANYKYYPIDENDPYSTSNPSIQFVYEDSRKRLWIGTAGGLDIYDRKHDRFKHFSHDPQSQNSLSDFSIQKAIAESSPSTFWIGTWDGLNKISLKDDFDLKFEKSASNLNDLAYFERYYHHILDTNSLNDNRITSININKDQSLWVSTYGGGLNQMTFLPNGSIKYTGFNENNGLSNNVVYCIFNDDKGDVWCSTNKGISQIKNQSHQILQYYKSDGLVSDEFFWGAGFKSQSEEIFLGGHNGFNAFFPDQIHDNQYQAPIVFTDLQVFYKKVKPGCSILSKNISEEKEIFLNWDDKVFSIGFAALHYKSPENIKYRYQLKGFDNEWINTDFHDRMITYTNLNPGSYEFCVQATNSDGIWNKETKTINIIIKPPFWQTWWFRILAFAMFVALIYGIFLIRLRSIYIQNRKLELQVNERTLDIEKQKQEISAQNEELIRLNKNKEKLVSILSHDLKGPIGNILTMVDILEDDWNSFTEKEKVEIFSRLKKHSQTNLELIDDSVEFVKLSWNKIEPNISERTISTLFKTIENTYLESLNQKRIQFVINGDLNEKVETDHDILKHILMNFVSNAIKFTPRGKLISLNVKTEKDQIRICVIDQGIGIPEEKLKSLFNDMDSFSRRGTDGEKSYGIGLQLVKEYAQIIQAKIKVDSEEDVGSQFCIELATKWTT